jgi:hypothetical protein
MGYLSSRHTLTLVIVSLPWAAAGVYVCASRFADLLRLKPAIARIGALVLFLSCLVLSVTLQSKPAHPSRWGHWSAAQWLRANVGPGRSILDTRGWAAFASDLPSYDYWHVRQALSDLSLSYIVVGDDELKAESARAATLRALLAYAAEPVAGFPAQRTDRSIGVWVYRFDRPKSWEGMRP